MERYADHGQYMVGWLGAKVASVTTAKFDGLQSSELERVRTAGQRAALRNITLVERRGFQGQLAHAHAGSVARLQ